MTLGFLGRLIASFVCFSLSSSAQALDDWQPIPSGIITRIAFGSCAKQWEPQPIWKTVAAAKPDLFLFVGDAIYGDWHGDQPFIPTETSLRADWDKLASKPEFALVRRQMPFMAIWDNHEFTSSGMTHVNPTYAKAPNKYRVAGPYVEHNIGLVEIDWQTDPSPRIRLTALGVGDRQGFSYEFALSNLKAHEKDHHQH